MSAIRAAGGGGMKLKKTETKDKWVKPKSQLFRLYFNLRFDEGMRISFDVVTCNNNSKVNITIGTAVLNTQIQTGAQGPGTHRTSPRLTDGADDGKLSLSFGLFMTELNDRPVPSSVHD